MKEYYITAGDIQYLSYYLKDEDDTTGTLTYHDITSASSIVFRMRKYGVSSNTISKAMEVVTGSLGYCRVLVTIPALGTYSTEIEVFESSQNITWEGPIYKVRSSFG